MKPVIQTLTPSGASRVPLAWDMSNVYWDSGLYWDSSIIENAPFKPTVNAAQDKVVINIAKDAIS